MTHEQYGREDYAQSIFVVHKSFYYFKIFHSLNPSLTEHFSNDIFCSWWSSWHASSLLVSLKHVKGSFSISATNERHKLLLFLRGWTKRTAVSRCLFYGHLMNLANACHRQATYEWWIFLACVLRYVSELLLLHLLLVFRRTDKLLKLYQEMNLVFCK